MVMEGEGSVFLLLYLPFKVNSPTHHFTCEIKHVYHHGPAWLSAVPETRGIAYAVTPIFYNLRFLASSSLIHLVFRANGVEVYLFQMEATCGTYQHTAGVENENKQRTTDLSEIVSA